LLLFVLQKDEQKQVDHTKEYIKEQE